MNEVDISVLVGKTLTVATGKVGDDVIHFTASDGSRFKMYHEQDCCEQVHIDDICGDIDDLVGSPIVQAEESSNTARSGCGFDQSETWTFYRLATAKGAVVIKWWGGSNGYYSEEVNFVQL